MWRFLALLVLTCSAATAKPVAMDSGSITFDAPDDFTPLTADEIDRKFPRHNGPIEAVGNQLRGASVSYTVTTNAMKAEQLDDFQRYMESALPKLAPSLQWITKESREINGTKWIYFEFTTTASDGGTIHNIKLFSSHHNVLVILNFNATAQLFGSYEKKFRDGVSSLKVQTAPGT